MDQDLANKPKRFPLGSVTSDVNFPIEQMQKLYSFWIPTIHNLTWFYTVDTIGSDKSNNVIFTITQKDQPNPFHSVGVEVGVVIENLDNNQFDLKAQGTYEFTRENEELKLEIPGFDKIIESKQRYFDDKKSDKTFKLRFLLVVKSVRLCDSVEFIDFYQCDPTIQDLEVDVLGHTMYLSKKLIALQSSYLTNLLEAQSIKWRDVPNDIEFDRFYLFLQILHGVDVYLDKNTIEQVVKIARHLGVPRVVEYCKQQLVAGCGGLNTNEIYKVAGDLGFWDVVSRKLSAAHSLADLKKQNWDLEAVGDDVIEMITRRVFELNC